MTDEAAIVPVENIRLGMIQVSGPREVVLQATAIAGELAKIVNDRKLFTVISGRKFVRVEGWTTLGAMLGVLPREVSTARHEDGTYEAVVELVRAGDGQVIGRGSAICGMDEQTWNKRAEYARRSMAITRATGKAYRLGFSWIMTLAGYEATPAEEMPDVIEGEVREVPAGHQPEQQPAGNGKSGGKMFKASIVKALVDAGLAENIPNASAMLNLSNLEPKTIMEEQAIAWGRLYRGWRNLDTEKHAAAERANQGEAPK